MSKQPAKGTRKVAGRVAFLARKDQFRDLLEAGHSQLAIYAEHGAALGISYSQFNRYIKQFLLNKDHKDEHQKEGTAGNPTRPLPAPSGKPSATGGAIPATTAKENQQGRVGGTFTHDPDSSKKRNHLI